MKLRRFIGANAWKFGRTTSRRVPGSYTGSPSAFLNLRTQFMTLNSRPGLLELPFVPLRALWPEATLRSYCVSLGGSTLRLLLDVSRMLLATQRLLHTPV